MFVQNNMFMNYDEKFFICIFEYVEKVLNFFEFMNRFLLLTAFI